MLRATDRTALVVGNPLVTDPRFPSLTGAKEEASAVAALLDKDEYDVDLLVEQVATPTAFLEALHERPLRILHLAAHGVFEFEHTKGQPPVTGLVLGDNTYFTSAEADQLRYVPELVFINCCFLGKTTGDAQPHKSYHRLAANLATQFIRMGARAVIAAGWEVDDGAAKTFASSFYKAMLGGALFGDAVLQARRDTYREHRDTNTWGAYQCYGDVSFSFGAGTSTSSTRPYVASTELRIWLENIPSRARVAGADTAALLEELEGRIATVPRHWLDSADIGALAGAAYASVGQFQQAIECYERLLTAERANAPMWAVEQLANCRVRWATQLGQAANTRPQALEELAKAEHLLRGLIGLGGTSERHSLLGGVLKRRAVFEPDRDRRIDALRGMAAEYGLAFDQSAPADNVGDPYPLANQAAALLALQWHGVAASGDDVVARVLLLDRAARARRAGRTDTFNLLAIAEHDLLQALLKGSLATTREQLADEYRRSVSRGARAGERDSIRTQFAFFRTMALALPDDEGRMLIEVLQQLEDDVLG